MDKAVVLSSGGLDSTTCLALAVEKLGKENVSSVSIYYGQKHDKELKCADVIAGYYGVTHYVIDLSDIFRESNCALIDRSKDVPDGSYAEQSEQGIVDTYVPFRNGLFLSAVASKAMSIYPDDTIEVCLGNHMDDFAGIAYADCSPMFIETMSRAIALGTYGKVTLISPFVRSTKADIVRIGTKLDVPYQLTWSCYRGGDEPCHTCATCIDREKAFELNGLKDPLCR